MIDGTTGDSMAPDDLRVAAVFDGEAGGAPFFTPDRVRVIDPEGRAALLRYLTGAPLVIRAAGLEPDPLDPSRGPAVPVGYRSDGVWVWQEATAYYLAERWVAPEDDLLAHIEGNDFTPPATLPDEVVDVAAAAAMDTSRVRPADTRDIQYYLRTDDGFSVDNPRGIFRIWTDPQGYPREESMQWVGRDYRDEAVPPFGTLRWRKTTRFISNRRSGEVDLDPFSTVDAAHALDVIVGRAASGRFPGQPAPKL
jgi:hypothetical protein